MKLYIANLTAQNLTFWFRVPESEKSGYEMGRRYAAIPPGSQMMIHRPDLNQKQIDGILEQAAIYGVCAQDETDRVRAHTTMCYSIDRPVSFHKIQKLLLRNHESMTLRGQVTRKNAAVNANHVVQNPSPDLEFSPKGIDVDFTEVPRKPGEEINLDDRIHVLKPGEHYAKPQRAARRGRRGQATAA